jgi:hypothetical protein
MAVNGATPGGAKPAESESRRAGELPLEVVYARISRQVVRDGARVIGFVPVDKPGRRTPDESPVGPVLEQLAVALTGFVQGDVAIVPAWPTWPPAPDDAAEPAGRMTIRELEPRVVEVLPRGCPDGASAALALEQVLHVLSEDFVHVLVDLTGYAAPGAAPTAVGLVEAAVLIATVRRARLATLRALSDQIPDSKHLGAILLDERRRRASR